jgi:hypothetical protein
MTASNAVLRSGLCGLLVDLVYGVFQDYCMNTEPKSIASKEYPAIDIREPQRYLVAMDLDS